MIPICEVMTMFLGLDVGGTHTDGVVIGTEGVMASAKVATDHSNLLNSINGALEKLLTEVRPGDIDRVNLSTTLSTNAIVEGKVEKVGVLVSAGPGIDPSHYAIGRNYHMVEGAIDHRGTEIKELDHNRAEQAFKECRKENIRLYSVVTKFSPRNPGQENALRQMLAKDADFVTVGHQLSGQLNFHRRIVTAYYNSAVWRLYNDFASAMDESFQKHGITAPINILKADGGTLPLLVSRNIPVESILSGPAASVMGIMALCRIVQDSLVLDIGGTTTDIALFASGIPLIEQEGISLEDRLTLVRALRTKSIGIGGDSAIAMVPGGITVGPERKGPSMAEGGVQPTLLDALNCLKIADHGDVGKSLAGMDDLAKKAGGSPEELARMAVDFSVATIRREVENLLKEINEKPVYTIHEMLEGKKIVPEALYLMGGPAKPFAGLLSEAFGLKAVVPEYYTVANAVGAALSRTTMEVELFADTEKKRMIIPNLNVNREIPANYNLEDARRDARAHLLKYMEEIGGGDHAEAEIIEASSFNMVGGFYTTGKNIRVKCQIKPGVLACLYG